MGKFQEVINLLPFITGLLWLILAGYELIKNGETIFGFIFIIIALLCFISGELGSINSKISKGVKK